MAACRCCKCPSILRFKTNHQNTAANAKSDLINEFAAMGVVSALMATVAFSLYSSHPVNATRNEEYQLFLTVSAAFSVLSWYIFTMSTFGYVIFVVFVTKMYNKKMLSEFESYWPVLNFMMFNCATVSLLASLCIDSFLRYGVTVGIVASSMMFISLCSWFALITSIDKQFFGEGNAFENVMESEK
eukprot:251753_1